MASNAGLVARRHDNGAVSGGPRGERFGSDGSAAQDDTGTTDDSLAPREHDHEHHKGGRGGHGRRGTSGSNGQRGTSGSNGEPGTSGSNNGGQPGTSGHI